MNNQFRLWMCFGMAALFSPWLVAQEQELTLQQARIQFAEADKALNKAYSTAKQQLSPEHFALLREEQREWLPWRDESATSAKEAYQEASDSEEAQADYWSTKFYITRTRTRMILGWLQPASTTGAWEGEWEDGYGGSLLIKDERDGTITFTIQAVRGRNFSTGAMSGRTQVHDLTAAFTEKAEGFDEYTTLRWTIQPEGVRLEVDGTFTMPYHGNGAYFDGVYTRVGPLTDELRAEMANL